MSEILTASFIDAIIDNGANLVYTSNRDDIYTEFYVGKSGRQIQILMAKEYIPATIAKAYLIQLGMKELISFLLPNEEIVSENKA